MDELFKPDTKDSTIRGVMDVLRRNANTNNIYGGLPVGTRVTYAMGGMVTLEDLPGRRPQLRTRWLAAGSGQLLRMEYGDHPWYPEIGIYLIKPVALR